jgi:hypothetical protein
MLPCRPLGVASGQNTSAVEDKAPVTTHATVVGEGRGDKGPGSQDLSTGNGGSSLCLNEKFAW